MTEQHKSTLYALGAVPVSELDREFWSDEAGQAVYSKGERVDVNGWLSPYWAQSGSFLTDAQKKRYGISKEPLTYAEYVSLLDVEGYRRTKHPLQYTIMVFVLENMLSECIEIENCDDMIRVYEAGIGLEERALPLLKGCLNSDQAIQLYNKHEDARLLDVFPVPQPEQEDYIEFLRTLAEREADTGWSALGLLYAMDKDTYKVAFRDFMIHRLRETDSLGKHVRMYRALAEIGDRESVQSLAASLLSDPVTEGREAILRTKLQADPRTHGGEGGFDYVVVDCPPSLGLLSLNAMAAVGEVLLPLQPHFLALHGLSKLLETIELVHDHVNPQLSLLGVVLCMYESSTRLSSEVGRDVAEFFAASVERHPSWASARLFDTRVRRNVRLAEAPSFGQSIFEYAADSNGAQDYAGLAEEVDRVANALQPVPQPDLRAAA